MTKTYDNFSGVTVHTAGGSVSAEMKKQKLSEREYRLATTCIMMTLGYGEHGINLDIDAAASALECYDYDQYESRPMIWSTLEEISNRI